jgi:transglutaminase-like putative cysteine protease
VLLTAAFLLFTGWHWARLEQPHIGFRELALLALLGVVPTVVAMLGGGRTPALIALAVATVAAIGQITHTWPWQTQHGIYPARVVELVGRGLRDWFGTHTPIDAGRFAGADHDLQLAFFAAAVALAWLIVRREAALPGIGVAFALFALPSTVLSLHANGFRAGVFLLLALLTLVATARRTGRPLAGDAQVVGLSVAVVLAGLIVGTAPGVTKTAFLTWQTWNPLANQGPRVSVDYMWNQSYAPLHWPKKRTTVLEVTSKKQMYWKAATLDTFLIDHWQFSQQGQLVGSSTGGTLTASPDSLPALEPVGHHVVNIKVKVVGLADDHLIGAAQPVRWTVPSGVQSLLDSNGTVTTLSDPARNATYGVQVYDPSPTVAQLTTAGHDFPASIRAGVEVGSVTVPVWGTAHPQATPPPLSPVFMRAVEQAWQTSHASFATNEYEAVFAIEHYFRAKPFKYTLTPKLDGPIPALAQFMLTTHRGYCQMFSGAMALVLRMHGIPARVAVGFMSGKLRGSDTYVVNDRDAHAWVEVYFPGYGWMPFEPTPGSHLPSDTSSSSPKFASTTTGIGKQFQGFAKLVSGGVAPGIRHVQGEEFGRFGSQGKGIGLGSGTILASHGSSHGRFITWLFSITLVLLAALLVLKAVSVRWRYLRRGPRAQAAAAYRDLATFVGDQGVALRPDETFEELAARLQTTFGVDAAAFARSATMARYAPLPTAEREGRQLRRQLRGIKHDVRRRLTPRERATGALRLRAALSQATLGS